MVDLTALFGDHVCAEPIEIVDFLTDDVLTVEIPSAAIAAVGLDPHATRRNW